MFPTLNIGPLSLQAPGLIMLLGVWLGVTFADRLASRFKVDGEALYNLVFTALIAGILGARLAYIASAPQAFLDKPLTMIALNPTLLDPIGGAVIGCLAALIHAHQNDLMAWKTLDALTPLAAVFNLAWGISHLSSGNAYGLKTNLPWGINLWNATRHPTQVYEIIAGLLILGFVWFKARKSTPENGQLFGTFLALASAAHLVISGFTGGSDVVIYGIRQGQITAFAVLGLSLWILGKTFPHGSDS